MSIPLSPLDKCPFDAPDPSCRRRLNSPDVHTSGGTDHLDYSEAPHQAVNVTLTTRARPMPSVRSLSWRLALPLPARRRSPR
jgi:hypothetical protein